MFQLHALHAIDNDLFHNTRVHDANSTYEKDASQNLPFLWKDAFSKWKQSQPKLMTFFPLKREGTGFQES